MQMTKKALIGCLAVILVAALAIGGTLAFMTATAEKTNVFTVGAGLEIDLTEEHWDPQKGIDLIPGSSMPKDPVVTAIEGDSYMRVVVSIVDKNDGVAAGTLVTDTDRLALIAKTIYFDQAYNTTTGIGTIDATALYTEKQLSEITGVFNRVNSDFTIDASRSTAGKTCYVYTGIFAANTSAVLFTNVVIPSDWNQTQMEILGKYDIVIQAQAIQADGFADADIAFEALDAELA